MIDWDGRIEDMPDECRDGREVLVWDKYSLMPRFVEWDVEERVWTDRNDKVIPSERLSHYALITPPAREPDAATGDAVAAEATAFKTWWDQYRGVKLPDQLPRKNEIAKAAFKAGLKTALLAREEELGRVKAELARANQLALAADIEAAPLRTERNLAVIDANVAQAELATARAEVERLKGEAEAMKERAANEVESRRFATGCGGHAIGWNAACTEIAAAIRALPVGTTTGEGV